MKKIILFALMFVLLLGLYACTQAEGGTYTSGDFSYTLNDDGTATITKYSGKAENLKIPATINGYSVSSTGVKAFSECINLTTVTIPDGVASIGDGAFYFCENLTTITIPDGVASIGNLAFFYCENLTTITIPDSVVTMGANPFGCCTNLRAIVVSTYNPHFATIDGILFNKDERKLVCYPSAFTAVSYKIPKGILAIGDWAFCNCSSLMTITIPDSVTSIGDMAFLFCENLMTITIPDGVTSIGKRAFYGCSSLTTITIPDSVTSIGDEAFSECDRLTIKVYTGSYAEQYAKENNIPFTYVEDNSWLY